ncbi:hypothetical protein V8E53_000652, partial [Lactarius tabidus]
MSDPAATSATNPTSTTAGGATGSSPDAGGAPSTGGTTVGTPIIINAQTFNSDSNWPSDLILDSAKGNWQEWDQCIHIIVDQHGFGAYLNGTIHCPDKTIHAAAAYSWSVSDLALRAFILEHVSDHNYNLT